MLERQMTMTSCNIDVMLTLPYYSVAAKGTSLLAPADDHDTRCRPLGLGVDIGVYEHPVLTSSP